jgi:hypothetical protein
MLIHTSNKDEHIKGVLMEDPSMAYEPRIAPDLSLDPITTVKSQPLLLISRRGDFDICLVDYGQGT